MSKKMSRIAVILSVVLSLAALSYAAIKLYRRFARKNEALCDVEPDIPTEIEEAGADEASETAAVEEAAAPSTEPATAAEQA